MLRTSASLTLAVRLLATMAVGCLVAVARVEAQAPASAPDGANRPLFAVEITIGAKWDPAKPPQEQQYFAEHSANLRRLREAGSLVLGARYGDKGLVVLAARDEADARAMMDEDPSMKAQVFTYQLHRFNVFYGGTVAPPRRAAP